MLNIIYNRNATYITVVAIHHALSFNSPELVEPCHTSKNPTLLQGEGAKAKMQGIPDFMLVQGSSSS